MTVRNCPSRAELEDFIAGTLAGDLAERFAEHLNDCNWCQKTISTCGDDGDTIVPLLRGARRQFVFCDEPNYPQIEESVRRLACPSHRGERESTTDNSHPQIPPILGQYRVLEKLGEGGMGAVYKAVHTRLDKVVAVKLLSPTRLRDAEALARFQTEIRAVGRLDHPNIVRATDAGEADGLHFLVMEYIQGDDLSVLLSRLGCLPIAEACELVRQAACGLQEASLHGMVHRDIKPSNLILAQQSHNGPILKILDLGLAALSDGVASDGPQLTTTGQIMGTLDYMAPEQGDDSRAVDIRADIYSLGATLYRLLCGEVVYADRQYASAMQKLTAIALQPAPPIQSRRAGVPDRLAAIIHRMLEKKPGARFATPAEVVSALTPFCVGADLARLISEPLPADSEIADLSNHATNHVGQQSAVPRISDNNVDPCSPPPVPVSPPVARKIVKEKPIAAWRWRMLALVPGMLFFAGVVMWLSTDGGYVQIESEPGVELMVELLKDGQHVDSIEVGRKNKAVWVRTGWYQIRLPAEAADEMEVSEKQFQLIHGQRKIVTVRRLTTTEFKAAASRTVVASAPADRAAPAVATAPFDAQQARRHQQAWADYLQVPVEYTNQIGMKFRLIPPGRFRQGNSAEFTASLLEGGVPPGLLESSQPQHQVELTKPFYLGIHEVTQQQFETICGFLPEPQVVRGPKHPVSHGRWQVAFEFCNRLSTAESLEPRYALKDDAASLRSNADGYRLPTEAEWEFACLAGAETLLTFDGVSKEYSRHDYNSTPTGSNRNQTWPVGSLQPNRFGLFDMRGNVTELCQDFYQPEYYQQFQNAVALDPQGPPTAGERVFRGAHYSGTIHEAALRRGGDGQGFRVALSVDAVRP